MKQTNTRIAFLASAVALLGFAQAATYNVDFGAAPGFNYSGVGMAPDLGTTWNSFNSGANSVALNPTAAALVDSQGAASTVALTLTGAISTYSASGAGVNNLLFDYAWVNGSVGTVSLTGLAPNQAFDLYLYGVGDNPAQNSLFTLDAANGGAFGTSPESDRTVMANSYVKISGATNGSGNVTFTWKVALPDNAGGFAGFNGFQLQTVPEPGAALLGGLGLLGLLRRRR